MNAYTRPRRGLRGLAHGLIRWPGVCVLGLILGLALGPAAHAQAFVLTGGSSSMFNAYGAGMEVRTTGYTSRLDLGYFNGLGAGFSVQHLYHNVLWDAGDQPIPFALPTDLFDPSYYFLGRGLSASQMFREAGAAPALKDKDTRLFVFAGATSDGYWAPFLNVAHTESLASVILYDRKISPSWRWYSRNIFSNHQTSIQSLEWTARPDIKMALSAGLGNNQGYWASSFAWHGQWASVDASYARAGANFRRVNVLTPEITENDRENIRFEFTPVKTVRIVASRNNYFSPLALTGGTVARAAVNGFGVWTSFSGTEFYGSLYDSKTALGTSQAYALGTQRNLTSRISAGVDYLGTRAAGQSSHTVVGTIRETLFPRLSLNQVITHGNGQTNVAFGGDFLSNLVTLSVDYQTVFFPFVSPGQGQFKRIVVLGVHFQLPHGVQLNAGTNVTPLGQVRYTAYATTYAYRGLAGGSSGTSFSGAFYANVVHGRVVDPQGEPIEGAALQIGTQLAVSDADGNFMLRVKRAGELPLKIAFNDFTAQGRYVVVDAPGRVRAAKEDSAEEYRIVLRRVPNAVTTGDTSIPPAVPAPLHGQE